MPYSDLLDEIFYEKRERISEDDFLKILPELLNTKSERWNGENLALIIRKKYGLGTDDNHTYNEIAKQFGVSVSAIRNQCAIALRKLRHPLNSAIIAIEPSEHELFIIKEHKEREWLDKLSKEATDVLNRFDQYDKEKYTEAFKHPPRMHYGRVIHPLVSDSYSKYTVKSERMSLETFNEIRIALGIDPFEQPKRKPTKAEIARAVKLLESEGYTVTRPST